MGVPQHVESGSDGSHWFDVTDPEGNKVEFVQPPSKPTPVPTNPLSSHIIHVGYIVHSRSAEDAFYQTVLGFRPYWFGGKSDNVVEWVSQQVPDGTDWLEYMVVSGPETRGIPATMSKDNLGVLNHFLAWTSRNRLICCGPETVLPASTATRRSGATESGSSICTTLTALERRSWSFSHRSNHAVLSSQRAVPNSDVDSTGEPSLPPQNLYRHSRATPPDHPATSSE